MKLLALFLLLISIPYNTYAECSASPTNISLNTLTYQEPTIYVNGSLRIYTGTSPADLVDVYLKGGEAYSGITSYSERVDDTDTRNFLLKWAFPKDLQASEYYLILKPNNQSKESIQGKKNAKVYVTLRRGNDVVRGAFFIDSDISFNCRPILAPKDPNTSP